MEKTVFSIVAQVRDVLQQNADETVRLSTQCFFKETVKCYGVASASVKLVCRQFMGAFPKLKTQAVKADVLACCEALWFSGYLEEGAVACHGVYEMRKLYVSADFEVFERWVSQYVNNWASCDTLCNHAVGDFVMMYPAYVGRLKKWAQSPNRWVKRGAAVSLIIPARKGLFLPDVFEIADLLLDDPDDMVQKGYGWMLKAASEVHQKEVFDFLMARKTTMPRTAFRYALEKMPKALKAQAMQKG